MAARPGPPSGSGPIAARGIPSPAIGAPRRPAAAPSFPWAPDRPAIAPARRCRPVSGSCRSKAGFGGGYGGGGSRLSPQPWRPPAGQSSPAAAASPPGLRSITFPRGQVQSKYKHASDFGLPSSWNSTNGARFEEVLRAHVVSPGTLRIVGTYRGQPVVHYLNADTGLNVMTSRQGDLISAWRTNAEQLRNIWQRGSQ